MLFSNVNLANQVPMYPNEQLYTRYLRSILFYVSILLTRIVGIMSMDN